MYLKSIEIQGFKSFANKTVFEFHNGITCIVGPNGSGKSNVADAVRWVLGEQSAKQLRGANMQDVIFAGTELRRPQGFASVAITFDNADHKLNIDYDEVTVTRRVYRSGESEYLLNGTACRLRDINELFFDTGIGKEGYSIIGQGQIDKILSSRPDDRRELFDEAAGIVKFKYRKAVAQKRLENEEANMVRLSDIMSELNRQVGPLERQSKAAREYLRLREELKGQEVGAFVLDCARLEKELAQTEDSLRIVTGDHASVQKDADALKGQYEAAQKQQEELERQAEEARNGISACQSSGQENEAQIRVLHEQINTEQLRKEHAKERIAALLDGKKAREVEQQELEKKRQELNRQVYDAEAKSSTTRQEIETVSARVSSLQKSIREDQEQVIRLLNQKSALSAETQKYQTMLEQYRIQKAQLNQKLLQSKEEEERFDGNLKEQKERLGQAQARLEQARTQLVKRESALAQLQKKQTEQQNRYSEQRRLHQASLTKAEALRNLAERYDGYGMSIRRVMEAKNRYPGICGVVADLIHTEKKYETAVETALGGSIQNIVTDTEQTAKELIGYLKQNRFGRATFLPLDSITIRDEFRQKEALREPGVIGLAHTLVQAEPQYRKVLEFLLGRIVVADTIDHAMKIAAKYRRSFRIVTLEGDLLNIGGSMTGGAFRNSSNLLGRSRELEELEKTIELEKQKLAQLETLIQTTAENRKEAEAELADARKIEQERALAETEARMGLKAAERRMEEIADSREQTVLEQRLLEQSIREASDKKQAVADRVNELEENGTKTQETAALYQREVQEAEEKKEALTAQSREEELQLAKLSQSDSFLAENLARLLSEQEKSCEELQTLEQELTAVQGNVAQKEAEIERLKTQSTEAKQRETELRASLESLTGKREAAAQGLKSFFERQEELSGRLGTLDKELFRLNHQKERLEENLDSQTEYLWSEYELRPSEAKAMAKPDGPSLSELKLRIAELKNSIKALGTVNVNAIEEYKELMERWTFMKTQYEDLVESRQSLLGVIDELDAGMRAQFEEKFEEIKKEFDKVFKELFGGGTGTVELVEGEDIIEAGITIISQPPGKKLQNMMQLSGGEKALTAIALLFAIQNLKPSPFCLLDEIEAALDDSNVGRFSGYLHKLTENTQFIVITHRRGTMAAADRLYGITMQEKGVSALVSVNLIEQQLDR